MVFPLHSVSGPGSKQLLNDGIEPISNRLKNQQAVTTPPAGGTGYGGGGGLSASQLRLLGIEVQIFVYAEIVVSTLTLDPTPTEQIKTVRLWVGTELWNAEHGCFCLTHNITDAQGTTLPRDKMAPGGHLWLLERRLVTDFNEHIYKSYRMFEPWMFTHTMRYEWWTIWPLETD